jgi:hypothetical protein
MRFTSSAAACAFAALAALRSAGADGGGEVRLLVQSSPLAGLRHHAAGALWPQLRVGDELVLAREPANPHDASAVRVEWRGHMLGYVPRRDNDALAWGMDRGERLRARISRLQMHRNSAKRIEFEVFIE